MQARRARRQMPAVMPSSRSLRTISPNRDPITLPENLLGGGLEGGPLLLMFGRALLQGTPLPAGGCRCGNAPSRFKRAGCCAPDSQPCRRRCRRRRQNPARAQLSRLVSTTSAGAALLPGSRRLHGASSSPMHLAAPQQPRTAPPHRAALRRCCRHRPPTAMGT